MNKAIIFGAGFRGETYFNLISEKYEVVAYTDNDPAKWGGIINGTKIINPDEIKKMEFDYIVCATTTGVEAVKAELKNLGISENMIDTSYVDTPLESRKMFIKSLAKMFADYNVEGDVAEAGVFQGEFAKIINECFPQKKLHLFDTFEGFDKRDIEKENGLSSAETGSYSNTTIDLVMRKMSNIENVFIHKGYFPETIKECENNLFCFVNIDMDLYEPTKQGLLFFSKRLSKNGIILCHDYFDEYYRGPKKAIDEFIFDNNNKFRLVPIGDGISVSIVQINKDYIY